MKPPGRWRHCAGSWMMKTMKTLRGNETRSAGTAANMREGAGTAEKVSAAAVMRGMQGMIDVTATVTVAGTSTTTSATASVATSATMNAAISVVITNATIDAATVNDTTSAATASAVATTDANTSAVTMSAATSTETRFLTGILVVRLTEILVAIERERVNSRRVGD